MLKLRRFNIICGHYGSGKTNLALNMALKGALEGKKITVVDLDTVNPYFRTAEYKSLLSEYDIELIAPQFAATNLDIPSLPPEINSIFLKNDRYVIVDVGGDDAGATVLGCFSARIKSIDDYSLLYVINKYRPLTQTGAEADEILKEIESAARLKATAIVNNSHLQGITTSEDILSSLKYAENVSSLTALPIEATVVPDFLEQELKDKINNLYPVKIIVKPPWAN